MMKRRGEGKSYKAEISAILLFLLAFCIFSYPVEEPKWKFWILDTEHAKRFVDLATDSKGVPHIIYFDEKNGGVRHITSRSYWNEFLDDIFYYFRGREWMEEVVDEGRGVGMFISATIDPEDRLHIAYQDSTLGREKLLYGFFDGKRWKKEVVDTAEKSGINVGMYASITLLKNKPIIFYHVEQGRKMKYAFKSKGWVDGEVERGKGWFIAADTHGNKAYVLFRERDGKGIWFGVWENGKWYSMPLNLTTSSGISIKVWEGVPYFVYFDDVKSKVIFGRADDFEPIEIGEGKLSRVDLDASEKGFFVTYYYQGKGLFFAKSKDGREWELTLLDKGQREGEYNAISVDEKGNVHVAYLNRTALKYAEYNVSSVETIKKILRGFAAFLACIGILILTRKMWKKYFSTKIKREKYKKEKEEKDN